MRIADRGLELVINEAPWVMQLVQDDTVISERAATVEQVDGGWLITAVFDTFTRATRFTEVVLRNDRGVEEREAGVTLLPAWRAYRHEFLIEHNV